MSQETDLAEYAETQLPAPVESTAPLTPTERITANEKMLAAIGPVIKKDHVIDQRGQSYVKVAGGVAIANALGFTISTTKPALIDDTEGQYYETTAYLLDNGRIIAEAVGYLGMDEDRWVSEPIYSRRSMAQTRAVARLCRQNFAHFYIAIGASDTAWEEIPVEASRPTPMKVAKKITRKAAAPNETITVPTDENGNEPADGKYQVTKCVLKKQGESNHGTWQIHTIHTAEGYEFDSFNVDPEDFTDEAVQAGLSATVKGIKSTQYGYDAKYIDAITNKDAAKVVEATVVVEEEIPF